MEEEESKWKIKVEESQKELKQVFLKLVFFFFPAARQVLLEVTEGV